MESASKEPTTEPLPDGVFEVSGEPAVVINGVPTVSADPGTPNYHEVASDVESNLNHWSGEWMEGREVKKLFGKKYYFGKVIEFDHETNWYRVVYEDGDFEDLEWHELQDVLVPLDISIPVRELSLKILKHKFVVSKTRQTKCKRKGEVICSDVLRRKRGRPKGKSKAVPEGIRKRGRPKGKNKATADRMGGTGRSKGKSMVTTNGVRRRGRPKGKNKVTDMKVGTSDETNAHKNDKIETVARGLGSIDGAWGMKLISSNTGGTNTPQSDNTQTNAGTLLKISGVDVKRSNTDEINEGLLHEDKSDTAKG